MEVKILLYNEIKDYCKLNNIDDVVKFINNMVRKGFTIEKYGDRPGFMKETVVKGEKLVEPIVIIEKPKTKTKKQPTPTPKEVKKNRDMYGE